MKKKDCEAFVDPWITDFADEDEENVGSDNVESAPLQTNEPSSKRSKKAQGDGLGVEVGWCTHTFQSVYFDTRQFGYVQTIPQDPTISARPVMSQAYLS
ncbi:hypothetical protein A2U01_0005422 [Trifolium medium]|uniref:Uncharacterized protein n=1 Tax=Trifolium medium TaxID=97028 RepID=A0A392MAQ1_9FABA|nr:hypothetical protein [Trifolium medium]